MSEVVALLSCLLVCAEWLLGALCCVAGLVFAALLTRGWY